MKNNNKHKSFSLKNSIIKSHYDYEGRYGKDHSIKRKISCLFDAIFSAYSEKVSHEHFDYLIIGDDSILSIICGMELSLKGYKTAIIPIKGRLDDNNQLRERIQRKLSYEALSIYLNVDSSPSSTELIDNLIKRNKQEGAIPLYFAVDHEFHYFEYKNKLHLIKTKNREKKASSLFRTTSVNCNRIRFSTDNKKISCKFYDIISSKNIIHTSLDNLMKIKKNDKGTLLLGVAEKDISEFKTY